MTPTRRCGTSLALLFALTLLGAAPALGATHTWIGPTNGTWSNPANWTGGAPTSAEPGGTIVKFGANTTSSMDIAGLTIDQIVFTGASNTINGDNTHDALTINGSIFAQNIVSDAAGNTLAALLPVTLTGAAVAAASSAGRLTIAGTVGGADGLVFVGTGGDFALSGENTYTGATTISSGALHIATATGDVIVGSSITIGDGIGPGAQLVLDQSSDISLQTPIIVNSDGEMDFQTHQDSAKSLTVNGGSVLGANLAMTGPLVMNDGRVTIDRFLSAGSLSMTGGTISGPGTLDLSGDIQATSSASGPAAVASGLQLGASPTVTVTPGPSAAPELRVTGIISETGGSRSITKAGTGTLLTSALNTYTGTTTVSAGTLLANGSQAGPFSVSQTGILGGSGTVGATTVAGVLAPTAPGLNTGALSFAPTGRLDVSITSAAPGSIPSVSTTGTVTIDPNAALNFVVAAGTALPHGTSLLLVDDDSPSAIGGQFNGVPTGSLLTTPGGMPLVASYAGGDGNDLTADNVAPQISSIAATPDPVAAGQAVALSVAESEANQDPLTTTWNFGDGTTATGTATSHPYASPGVYTVVATASDGLAQAQSTTVITVTGMATGGSTKTPAGGRTAMPTGHGTGSAGTSTVKSSGYGADFSLTVPSACVRTATPFSVTLSIKKQAKGKARGHLLVKVTKVVFSIGRTLNTKLAAPFRVPLAVSRTAASGSTIKLTAKAYLKIRGGKRRAKSITAAVKVC